MLLVAAIAAAIATAAFAFTRRWPCHPCGVEYSTFRALQRHNKVVHHE